MRFRFLVAFFALTALMAVSAPAQAAVVQADMSDVFNKDVIVNGTTVGNLDETQSSVDLKAASFITQGAAKVLANCTGDPDGLPNKGKFAKNDDHPFIDLAYDNTKNGKNARRSPSLDSYRVDLPRQRYRSVHIAATSGEGDSTMKVKLIYTSGDPTQQTFTVQDWFDEPGEGSYFLTDGRDRAAHDASECFDEDQAALFGFKVPADKDRRLVAVRIKRPSDDGGAVLTVYGITGKTLT
jgi:hypothetical protein